MLLRMLCWIVLLMLPLSGCVTDTKTAGNDSLSPATATGSKQSSGKSGEVLVDPNSPIPMEDQILGGMAMIIPDDLMRQNKVDEALKEYAKVAENEDFPKLYRASASMSRGDIFARKGDFAGAAEAYARAAELYSAVSYPNVDMRNDTERALTGALMAYMRLNDRESATALMQKYDFARQVEKDADWAEQPDGFLLHTHTNIMVPESIGSFALVKKTGSSKTPDDFALSYRSDRYGAISIFRFLPRNLSPRDEAENSYQLMVRTRKVDGTPMRFEIGANEIAGLDMAGYGVEDQAPSKSGKITFSEGVIVLARGNEFLKFRYTVVRPIDLEEAEPWGPTLIDNFANKIRWTNS